jgi:hypothetical protein
MKVIRHDDDYLDWCAKLYAANPCLRVRGIRYDAFVQAPRAILRAQAFGTMPLIDGDEFRPLLPRQEKAQLEADFQETLQQIAADLEADLDHLHHVIGPRRQSQAARICDGRAIQPMHPRAIAGERCTRVRR